MDKKAIFNGLYDSHHAKVFRLCKGYFTGNEALAADATQEIFIKVWENLETFRSESSIKTWLYRIAVNTCLIFLRKSSSKKEINSEVLPQIASEPYSDEKEEQLKKMYHCIEKLDETGKMIILMILEGIEYQEISEIVGITEETLRVRIHRIKKNLTQCAQNENI